MDLMCLSHPNTAYKNNGSGTFTNCPTNNCGLPLYPGVVEQSSQGLDGWLESQYRIEGLIAEAGQSRVYVATRRNKENPLDLSKQKVAVKAIRLDNAAFADPADFQTALDCFNAEAQLLTKLEHPGIVKLYGHQFYDARRAFTVMEFVEGKTLERMAQELALRGERFDYSELIEYAVQVCDVLEYIHSQKDSGKVLIYRDLSPDNVMVQPDRKIKLLDFGIAKFCSGQQTHTARGKEAYAPVEQWQGKAEPRSDQYGLAATMHTLITGKAPVPFDFPPIRDYRSDVPSHLEVALQKALSSDLSKRFPDISDFKQAITDNSAINIIPAGGLPPGCQQTSNGIIFPANSIIEGETKSGFYTAIDYLRSTCQSDSETLQPKDSSGRFRPLTLWEFWKYVVDHQAADLLDNYHDTYTAIINEAKTYNFMIDPECQDLLNISSNHGTYLPVNDFRQRKLPIIDSSEKDSQKQPYYNAGLDRQRFMNCKGWHFGLREDTTLKKDVFDFVSQLKQRDYNILGFHVNQKTSQNELRALFANYLYYNCSADGRNNLYSARLPRVARKKIP